jgi:RNA polymerase sigma-70 factor, ECF subfamily
MLPHLDAAWNLARHLMRNDADAEDVVQDALLRALRFFNDFRGENPRGWLLAIVRHAAHSQRRRDRVAAITTEFNEVVHSDADAGADPAHHVERQDAARALDAALDRLPAQFREVLVLRELESLSYDEIARIVRAPIGTVMSRLSRARARLTRLLTTDSEAAS